MTQKDRQLLEEARKLPWWEIDESLAETEEGREALYNLTVREYHKDEARVGMI